METAVSRGSPCRADPWTIPARPSASGLTCATYAKECRGFPDGSSVSLGARTMRCRWGPSRAARRLYVLPAAPDHPYPQHNRADDEQDAYQLGARRVIVPPVHDDADAEGDGKDHSEILHGSPSLRPNTAVAGAGSASWMQCRIFKWWRCGVVHSSTHSS